MCCFVDTFSRDLTLSHLHSRPPPQPITADPRTTPTTNDSPEAAAEDLVKALTAPRHEVAGRYLSLGARPAREAPFARDEGRCRELWERACTALRLETHPSLA